MVYQYPKADSKNQKSYHVWRCCVGHNNQFAYTKGKPVRYVIYFSCVYYTSCVDWDEVIEELKSLRQGEGLNYRINTLLMSKGIRIKDVLNNKFIKTPKF